MRHSLFAIILMIGLDSARAVAADPLASPDPGGVLKQHTIASFPGSGSTTIQGIATDANGNIYVAGTTSSPDLPVINAAQPSFGQSRILRTTDFGASWTSAGNPPVAVEHVVPDPAVPQVLFAVGVSSIYKTVDAGETWRLVYTLQSAPLSGSSGFDLAVDPGNHLRLAALTPDGKFARSLDGGETWTSVRAECGATLCTGHILADPSGSGSLLILNDDLSISHDWGQTFQYVHGGLISAAFDPLHLGWIYADFSTGPPFTGSLELSTDYGATWTRKADPPTVLSAIFQLGVDPHQPDTLFAATGEGLYKSSDGAASWTREPLEFYGSPSGGSFTFVSAKCNPDGGLFAGGFFSPDDGVTWQTIQFDNVSNNFSRDGLDCAFYSGQRLTSHAFVAKLDPEGTELWGTFLGGSQLDATVALALDSQGNAYVTGNTHSIDFPTTLPPIGARGQTNVFVTKLSAEGELLYSVILGGESSDSVAAIAVDLDQNAYVVGTTSSVTFPFTVGIAFPPPPITRATGFVARLSPDATLDYASYLGGTFPTAILVDANGNPIIGGFGAAVPGFPPPSILGTEYQYVMKLDQAASQTISTSYISAGSASVPLSLATDAQGNLFVGGFTPGPDYPVTPGAYASPLPSVKCYVFFGGDTSGYVYLAKLGAADWQPVYTARLAGQCGSQLGSIVVDNAGAVILPMLSGRGFPLHNPLVAGPTCFGSVFGSSASAIAKLSPDGSTLQFATYLDDCGIPSVALAKDGSLYAGVAYDSGPPGVLHLSTEETPPISLDRISNAFSGNPGSVASEGLFSLTVSGFQPDSIDLGLNPKQALPTQLAGVQVTFDGIPAPILQTSPGRVIVVPPVHPPAVTDFSPVFTAVQVSYHGVQSNVVWMPVSKSQPGLLTRDFPNPPQDFADGNIRNEDGTLNDADHPAVAGSSFMLFVTGLGATNPPAAPGAVANSVTTPVIPDTAIYTSWNGSWTPDAAYTVPGFVSALFQIRVKLPNDVTRAGGVQRLYIYLTFFNSSAVPVVVPVSNIVSVYVK